MSTPQASPAKAVPTNPYNTPQTSPVRFSIFRTEHEIIHEAAGELENVHLDPSNVVKPTPETDQGKQENVDLMDKMIATPVVVGESSPRKRRRAAHDEDYQTGTEYSSPNDEDDDSEEDEDDNYNPAQSRTKSKSKPKQPKRSLKALPKTRTTASARARRPAPFADAEDTQGGGPVEKNPFLVS